MKNKYNEYIKKLYKEYTFEVSSYKNERIKAIEVSQMQNNDEEVEYIPTLFIVLNYKTKEFSCYTRSTFFDKEIKNIKETFERYFKIETLPLIFKK